ncbi:MAG: hypothetical protein IPM37_19870 [Hahellaceae bacterium]|jgi:chromosome segregation ATPase|nr:hypothetical protein [Hahellaceae bacterium]
MSSHHTAIQKFSQKLEELDYTLDRLEHRLQDLPGEIKASASIKVQKLRDYRAELQEKEKALLEQSEEKLHNVEAVIDDALDTVKILFEDIQIDMKVEGV